MLSETLSSLCDTLPTPHYRRSATYACRHPFPPPRVPLHHHHCSLPASSAYGYPAEPAVLLCPRPREYQELPFPVVHRPPPHAATVRHAAQSEVVILDQEEDEVLRQAMQMQQSIALLSTSVQQLEAPPAPKRKYLGLSTRQVMAVIIDAQSTGEGCMEGELSSLYQVLRKKRDQPRYQCSECGSATTTQWRNSPSGKKICNPCGMRQWRSRQRTGSSKSSSGDEKEDEIPRCPHGGDVTKSPQSTEDVVFVPSRRSNIYSLLN